MRKVEGRSRENEGRRSLIWREEERSHWERSGAWREMPGGSLEHRGAGEELGAPASLGEQDGGAAQNSGASAGVAGEKAKFPLFYKNSK